MTKANTSMFQLCMHALTISGPFRTQPRPGYSLVNAVLFSYTCRRLLIVFSHILCLTTLHKIYL